MRAHRPLLTTAGVISLAFLSLASTGTHLVRSGETLAEIAARNGVTVHDLAAINDLADPDLIHPGQELVLPDAEGVGAADAPSHVVRAGDTVGGIAERYGISQVQLIEANGLTGTQIYAGQHLRLDGGEGGGTGPGSHTVRPGDTLLAIALERGTTVRALQQANGIQDVDEVRVGRTLSVPGTGSGARTPDITCPVPSARFVNDWGFPRSGGRAHEGNDLFADRGAPAVATVDGTVVQTSGRIGGHQVSLLGDDGVTYHYTHLDDFGRDGWVSAGTVIGYVGSTGNAIGGPPHVHFEVHPAGDRAVNPFPRLAAAC